MKIISLVLALCMTLNVFAASGTNKELELLIDSYQFDLSVEWDQKDQKFFESKTKAFFASMNTLMLERGITKEEVLALLESKTKNKALIDSLRTKFMLLGEKKSVTEITKIIQDHADELYTKGASWNGEIVIPVVAGLLIVGLVAYLIWYSANHECVETEQRWKCTTQQYNTDTSYPSSDTICGWQDVCTRYERKI